MQQLPNNCRAGNFAVFPSNWKTISANRNLIWRITYWFYDDNINQKKQIVVKGMNAASNLKDKQLLVKTAIDTEIFRLSEQGYNPITKNYSTPVDCEISAFTPLIQALEYAFNNMQVLANTKIDIKSCLKYITLSIKSLQYDRLSIGQVRRKHVKFILEGCSKIEFIHDYKGKATGVKKRWSENLFNHYRKYLSVLFKQLVEIDAIDVNPVREITKRSQLRRIRETLTTEQRKKVNEFTRDHYPSFWVFLQIFFHSGARITELLNVKKKDVDIAAQKYKIVVRKGRKYQEEYRTIKTIAVPFWQELIDSAQHDHYLFSRGLIPGYEKNKTKQVSHRWKKHLKEKLGITADLYSLKHSNLDEIAGSSGVEVSQQLAGHSTPVITMLYAQGEKERQHNRLKGVNNPF